MDRTILDVHCSGAWAGGTRGNVRRQRRVFDEASGLTLGRLGGVDHAPVRVLWRTRLPRLLDSTYEVVVTLPEVGYAGLGHGAVVTPTGDSTRLEEGDDY